MSNRERKRSARKKRKQRSGAGESPSESAAGSSPAEGSAAGSTPAEGSAGEHDGEDGTEGEGAAPTDIAAEAERLGVSTSELKNQRAREQLEPLEPGERPTVVTIGAIVSALIALITIGAWIGGAEVSVTNSEASRRPNALQVLAPSILFAVMAYGMWRARYWAVLGFQAIMAIFMVGAFITLVGATSVFRAITAVIVLAAAGTLFWFMVKALARIQMPERHMPR